MNNAKTTARWDEQMARWRGSAQGVAGGNPPPAPPPQQNARRRVPHAPPPVVGHLPPSPPSPPSGGGGGGFKGWAAENRILVLFLALLGVSFIGLVFNDFMLERSVKHLKELKALEAVDAKNIPSRSNADELQLPRNSSVTLTGPARKVLVNSANRIKSWNGEFMLSMENAQTDSWTPGFSPNPPPMPMDVYLAKLRELHAKGGGLDRHRFWIEVKSGQTVQLQTD